MSTSFDDIPSFVETAADCIARAASAIRLGETRETRVIRRFSFNEVAAIIGCNRKHLYPILEHPDAPEGEMRGRERTFSVSDIMTIRAIGAANSSSRKTFLSWRKPGDALPVICVGSQKGGTGKSVTSAHLAQYAALHYGMRVGVIDADPQSTCSLYFVDDRTNISGNDVMTFTDFMGVPEPGSPDPVQLEAAELDTFWQATPWPGLRIMPGGAAIQEADIAMYFLGQQRRGGSFRIDCMLRDALNRWGEVHQPKTVPSEVLGPDGRLDQARFDSALTETLDLIVIDTAPSLSLAQLNAVMAATTLCIPQTMKGFDLWTLQVYLSSLNDWLNVAMTSRTAIPFAKARPFILPTIVARNNDTDLRTLGEIYSINPDVISPIYYKASDGAANAFREYKSVYEYQPDRARRASVNAFVENANAVNDAILSRAIPSLVSRGYANDFIRNEYPEGMIPLWSEGGEVAVNEDAA